MATTIYFGSNDGKKEKVSYEEACRIMREMDDFEYLNMNTGKRALQIPIKKAGFELAELIRNETERVHISRA